ncbi:MAG: DUF1186 domain-containing protein [Bacteroidales bacterium]|nr:DUF1186 domain-containing protein [Bacteroidales bacterium]
MNTIIKILVKSYPNEYSSFLRETMRLAVQQKEPLTTELLELLKMVAKNPQSVEMNSQINDYGFGFGFVQAAYFLAELREKRAYPLIIECLSQVDKLDIYWKNHHLVGF